MGGAREASAIDYASLDGIYYSGKVGLLNKTFALELIKHLGGALFSRSGNDD